MKKISMFLFLFLSSPVYSQNATFTVKVPHDAKVYVNKTLMTATGEIRKYKTPRLTAKEWDFYDFKVDLTRNNKTTFRKERVVFWDKEHVQLSFMDLIEDVEKNNYPKKDQLAHDIKMFNKRSIQEYGIREVEDFMVAPPAINPSFITDVIYTRLEEDKLKVRIDVMKVFSDRRFGFGRITDYTSERYYLFYTMKNEEWMLESYR